jgi:hypothetical protein
MPQALPRFPVFSKAASGPRALGPEQVPRAGEPAEVLERLLASLSAILRSDGEAGEEGGRSRGEGRQHSGHDEPVSVIPANMKDGGDLWSTARVARATHQTAD